VRNTPAVNRAAIAMLVFKFISSAACCGTYTEIVSEDSPNKTVVCTVQVLLKEVRTAIRIAFGTKAKSEFFDDKRCLGPRTIKN
jgi:hypothetical protein